MTRRARRRRPSNPRIRATVAAVDDPVLDGAAVLEIGAGTRYYLAAVLDAVPAIGVAPVESTVAL